jgi:L-ribulose-5-phosphate 3-epimerase|tara:strand:- start:1248 stop:2051 length:804 start_codon:yes stop_codon:yes gene_type:complete
MGKAGYEKIDFLDFPKVTRELGIEACEYVNAFFPNREPETAFIKELNKRSKEEGINNQLIMIDKKGSLGDPDKKARMESVKLHQAWVDAAAEMGCHSIRVNASSAGSREEQLKLLTDGVTQLCEYSEKLGINILFENHGGFSSDGAFLAKLVDTINLPNCGNLPDFGNFYNRTTETQYPMYEGTEAMLEKAMAVSAKAYDPVPNKPYYTQHYITPVVFDFRKMMHLVFESGYTGYYGIEYEGENLEKNEKAGILRTKKWMEEIWAAY